MVVLLIIGLIIFILFAGSTIFVAKKLNSCLISPTMAKLLVVFFDS